MLFAELPAVFPVRGKSPGQPVVVCCTSRLSRSTDEQAPSCSAIPLSRHCRIRVKRGWRVRAAGSPRLESILDRQLSNSAPPARASHILVPYLARFTTKNVSSTSKPRILLEIFPHCIMSHLERTWRTDYFCGKLHILNTVTCYPSVCPSLSNPSPAHHSMYVISTTSN